MNRAIAKRLREGVVDEPVLVDEREPLEARARQHHLEVVAAAGPVLDAHGRRVRKRVTEQMFERRDGHAAMLATPNAPAAHSHFTSPG